ncbi:MAG: bifunctional oligoribonuclease/PAP phosphatase NrnA [Cyclobacteriaceae bacterium]|nr:bifunctional oligoribonuclease/PAP phosphatase NrnA [Cyclobacteriaceae bacterium]
MENIQAFKRLLDVPRKVVVVTHFKPDADALGSSLGLAGFLKKKSHSVQVVTPSDYPSFLAWMPGNDEVIAVSKDNPSPGLRAKAAIAEADMLFCLDFSALKRTEDLQDAIRQSKAVKVLIDHHLEPEKFADFEQWTTASASTAGLIFNLIEELGEEDLIDADVANCLYAGLMTDTGGFRHSNTTRSEFMIASALVGRGANPSLVAKLIYDNNTLERLRLTGFVLAEKLKVLPEYRTAYMVLSAEELKRFGSQTGDTEGLVNYGLSISNIRLSVLLHERKSEIKYSFRSLGDFSVNELARKHFEGGGHKNAAGGTFNGTLEEALKKFLDLLPEYKSKLNS